MKYNNLKELRKQKESLKKDVAELEDLLKFSNTKESLSAFTNGFTDQYLTEKTTKSGNTKLALKTGNIIKDLGSSLTNRSKKKSIIEFDNANLQGNIVESAIKLGSVALIGSIAKKNMKSKNWKNKALGLALVYVLPFALKFARRKLQEYQTQKSLSSMEKLI